MKLSTSGHHVEDDARLWRTLVHFMCRSDDLWYVSLPGWSRYVLVSVKHDALPDFIQEKVEDGFRCHAKVNTGEDDPWKIIFEDWEQGILCEWCERGVFHTRAGDPNTLVCKHCNKSVQ